MAGEEPSADVFGGNVFVFISFAKETFRASASSTL